MNRMTKLHAHILFEDDDVWVYNKPENVSILRDRGGHEDLWSVLKEGPKPYLVHRLDKGTSGVWAVAKNQKTQSLLSQAFAHRAVSKFYVALVDGTLPRGTHHIDLPLAKGRKSRYRIAGQRDRIKLKNKTYRVEQDREGVKALTSFRALSIKNGRSLVLVHPNTGRTHQIRVHLGWLGFPIVGDSLYNKNYNKAANTSVIENGRLFLHAHYLRFSGYKPFIAPLPEEFHA